MLRIPFAREPLDAGAVALVLRGHGDPVSSHAFAEERPEEVAAALRRHLRGDVR